jgi:hypothetical protein
VGSKIEGDFDQSVDGSLVKAIISMYSSEKSLDSTFTRSAFLAVGGWKAILSSSSEELMLIRKVG